jgi:hypothetical protein
MGKKTKKKTTELNIFKNIASKMVKTHLKIFIAGKLWIWNLNQLRASCYISLYVESSNIVLLPK